MRCLDSGPYGGGVHRCSINETENGRGRSAAAEPSEGEKPEKKGLQRAIQAEKREPGEAHKAKVKKRSRPTKGVQKIAGGESSKSTAHRKKAVV